MSALLQKEGFKLLFSVCVCVVTSPLRQSGGKLVFVTVRFKVSGEEVSATAALFVAGEMREEPPM